MFTPVMNPVLSFQVAPVLAGMNCAAINQETTTCQIGLWEFPNEAELAEELFAALSAPLPAVAAPEIAPEDFERFARGFLS